MDDLPFLPTNTTFRVEGKIAHLFYDGNTGQQRDLIECFQSYPWEKKFIIMKMDCLAESMIASLEDGMKYYALGQELDEVKAKESKDEKIIRAILMRMGCLIANMDRFEEEDIGGYPTLSEEMAMINRNTPKHEKIIRTLAELNLEKIYVYE